MNRFVAMVAAAALLMFSAWQAPAKDLLDYVPADSEVVVAINVADIATRPVIQDLWHEELADGPAGAGVRMFERLTGMNVTRDLESIVIAGQVDRDETGIALIKASYDEEALLDLLRLNPRYGLIEFEGLSMHRWKDDGEKFGMFLPEGIVLVGNSAARVQEALASSGVASHNFGGRQGADIPANADAWIWLRRPERAGTQLGDGMQMIGLAGTITRLAFEADDVVVETSFQPDKPEDVQDHRALLDGLLGIGRLQQRKPVLAEIANMTNTEVRNGRAVLTTRVSNDDFTRMLREAADRRR